MCKTNKFLLVSVAVLFLAISCVPGDDTGPDNLETIGTYAGVLVGSSGHYIVELKETNSTAVIDFDGNTYNLSTTEELKKGQEVVDLSLSDGTNSIIFSAKADGTNPNIAFTIPGHKIVSTINYITPEFGMVIYKGGGSSTLNEAEIQFAFNLSIYRESNNTRRFKALEKVTHSTDEDQIGETTRVEGTVEVTENTVILFFRADGANSSLVLDKDGDNLSYSKLGSDNYTLFYHLTKAKTKLLSIPL